MSEKTLYIVQQFEKQGRKLVQGRQMEFKTSDEARGRAERDAERVAGVVAVAQTVDTETGEVLEEPEILAHYGELPPGMLGD
ncbi:hypothetical protein [Pararhizobium mangrovi]|uniref:Uncharacterized protein n=1 Tax=Pararhizobium mangrovi TaxID=2590452 RepID=A0A506TZJ9_9HYPH|nr:hypothetical protein [Pararhizobium mangrovi]TPW26930.1 hypothetical protein FJU11_13250 [Pararhizobium mangrovi]